MKDIRRRAQPWGALGRVVEKMIVLVLKGAFGGARYCSKLQQVVEYRNSDLFAAFGEPNLVEST
jgi:hypothetical protein